MSICVLFKQKTAYEVRISDWSSDVCSSDLIFGRPLAGQIFFGRQVPEDAISRRRIQIGDRVGGQRDRHRVRQHARACSDRNAIFIARQWVIPIGSTSCRESVCQYVELSVVAVSLKKKTKINSAEPKK